MYNHIIMYIQLYMSLYRKYYKSLTQIVQQGRDVVFKCLEAQEEVKVHGTRVT